MRWQGRATCKKTKPLVSRKRKVQQKSRAGEEEGKLSSLQTILNTKNKTDSKRRERRGADFS